MSASLNPTPREPLQPLFGDSTNPLGLDGLEFIEYATSRPQALGQVLEMMGFRPIARHRSREVMLYRQGGMNIVVNSGLPPGSVDNQLSAAPRISAIAVRVRDARTAWHYVMERGAWAAQSHAQAMELQIPAIHGVGGSRIYFVDRYREFSIYDIDFVPIPGVEKNPPATAGMEYFGVVQYIGPSRMEDWLAFYGELFGARLVPDDVRYGILPKGKVLWMPALTPGRSFALQLIEPEHNVADVAESLQRIGLAVPDVAQAVRTLRERGVEFVDAIASADGPLRGAVTKTSLQTVTFELVHCAQNIAELSAGV